MGDELTNRSLNTPSEVEPPFVRQVAADSARKLRAQREGTRSVWFGLGMTGLIGWSVAVPTLGGVMLGLWLDLRHPEFMDELKSSGIEQNQAEAITRATSQALSQTIELKELATKNDLKEGLNKLFIKICSLIIVAILGLAGIMAHGFHWI